MKKTSPKFKQSAAKMFFVNHGEKVAFSFAVLMVVCLVYSGFGIPRLDLAQTPDALIKDTQTAKTNINASDFEPFSAFQAANVEVANTIRKQSVIKEGDFAFGVPRDLPKAQTLREDPTLRAPMQLEVNGDVVTIAVRQNKSNPLDNLPEALEEKERVRPSRNTDDGGFGEDGGYGGEDEVGGEDDFGGYGDDDAVAEEDAGTPKTLGELQIRETEGVAGLDGQEAHLVGRYVVAVKAIVPYELQWDEFNSKLENAVSWDPTRDRPHYLRLVVEREATAPDGTVVAWTDVSNSVYGFASIYAAFAPEICDYNFTDPNLTLNMPAFLCQDYRRFAKHSNVPLAELESNMYDEEEVVEDTATADSLFEGAAEAGKGATSTGSGDDGYGGYGDEDEYGGDDEEGGFGGYGDFTVSPELARPEAQYKMIRFFDFQTKPGFSYRYKVRLWINDPNNAGDLSAITSGGGEEGFGGYGGDEEGYDGGGSLGGSGVALSGTALTPEVRRRINEWKKSPEYAAIPDELKHLRNGRLTDWSDPSEIHKVPVAANSYYAGPISAPTKVEAKGVKFELGERSGKIIASVFNKNYAVKVPVQFTLLRGALLDSPSTSKRKVEVLNPRDMTIREFVEVETDIDGKETKTPIAISSGGIVIDILGGEKLPTKDSRARDFKVPGEVLVFDSKNGTFTVRNELDDMMNYRHGIFEKPVVKEAVDEFEDEDEFGGYGDDEF